MPLCTARCARKVTRFIGSHLFDCIGIVGGNQMNLKSMSIDRLTGLRARVEAALNSKVIDQRRALESELAKLNRFPDGKRRLKFGPGNGVRGPVAPKYRNTQNPCERRLETMQNMA